MNKWNFTSGTWHPDHSFSRGTGFRLLFENGGYKVQSENPITLGKKIPKEPLIFIEYPFPVEEYLDNMNKWINLFPEELRYRFPWLGRDVSLSISKARDEDFQLLNSPFYKPFWQKVRDGILVWKGCVWEFTSKDGYTLFDDIGQCLISIDCSHDQRVLYHCKLIIETLDIKNTLSDWKELSYLIRYLKLGIDDEKKVVKQVEKIVDNSKSWNRRMKLLWLLEKIE